MSWNNGYERRKFEARQKKQAAEYRALGMTEEQIKTMYEFDLEQFNCDRKYHRHTQEFTLSDFDDDGVESGRSPMFERFAEQLTTTMENVRFSSGRYAWFEDFNNDEVREWLYALPEEDKEILTLLVEEHLTQSEIAIIIGVSQQAISKKIVKFKKILSEWL